MQTKTELFNLAANHLGSRNVLSGSGVKNRYAEQFEMLETFVRRLVLSSAHWSIARAETNLALHKTRAAGPWRDGDVSPGYEKSYLIPADYLYPRYLHSGARFRLGVSGEQRVLSTADEAPILEYTRDVENYGFYDSQLFLVLSYALAAYAAYAITGRLNIAERLQNMANESIATARAANANADPEPKAYVASWHAARGYFARPQSLRFVYPHGELVSVGVNADVK